MKNKPQILRPTTDNYYEYMLHKTMALPEGILSGENVMDLYEFSKDGQCVGFLNTQKHLPFQVSPTGDVIPQFTKWEIVHQLEKEDRELKRKYISSEPTIKEGLL